MFFLIDKIMGKENEFEKKTKPYLRHLFGCSKFWDFAKVLLLKQQIFNLL